MKIEKIKILKPTKENNFAKLDKDIPSSGGANDNGRLQIEDKGTYFEKNYNTCIPKGAAKYYSYIPEEDPWKRGMIESFLFLIIRTRFNNCNKINAIKDYLKDKQSEGNSKEAIGKNI